MAPDQPEEANRYRISRLEQDMHDLRQDLRDYSALKQTVVDLVADNREVRQEMSALRRALYTAALSVSGAAVLFAATFFASQ